MIEYTQTELRILALFSALGAAFSWAVGGIDAPIQYFLFLTAVDYATGMIAAWRTSSLSSNKAFDGIKHKVVILAVLTLANAIDVAAGLNHVLRGTVLFTYAVMEGLSIVENLDRIGWGQYIPEFLRSKLIQIQDEKGVKTNGKC